MYRNKMAIMLETTARFLLLVFVSFGGTMGSTVSVSMSPETGNVGEPLVLTCLLTPSPDAIINTVKWFLDNDTNGIQRNARSCKAAVSPTSYNLTRYNFTCDNSSNTFKMTIKELQKSDHDQCWSCSVAFTNVPETGKAQDCIKVQDKLTVNPTDNNTFNKNWLFLLFLLVPIAFIIGFVVYHKKRLKDNYVGGRKGEEAKWQGKKEAEKMLV